MLLLWQSPKLTTKPDLPIVVTLYEYLPLPVEPSLHRQKQQQRQEQQSYEHNGHSDERPERQQKLRRQLSTVGLTLHSRSNHTCKAPTTTIGTNRHSANLIHCLYSRQTCCVKGAHGARVTEVRSAAFTLGGE
jgi:hypothetical protein